MKKAIIVEFTFMTRLIVDDLEGPDGIERIDAQDKEIIEKARPKIMQQVINELSENLTMVYDDLECPYDEELDTNISNHSLFSHIFK